MFIEVFDAMQTARITSSDFVSRTELPDTVSNKSQGTVVHVVMASESRFAGSVHSRFDGQVSQTR